MDDDSAAIAGDGPLLRAMSLRALGYCERLFYLEEVEGLYRANAPVYDGRALHDEIERKEQLPLTRMVFTSERLGLTGTVDALRYRGGELVPYEHKKGRARRDGARYAAWPGDRLQAIAYALLLEEETGRAIPEARIRYHADDALVRIAIDGQARLDLTEALQRAHELRSSLERPPIAENPALCVHCALAPVCLPEEVRWASVPTPTSGTVAPERDAGSTLHILSRRAYVGKSGNRIVVTDEGEKRQYPIESVTAIVLHGSAQITSQAISFCLSEGVAIHWLSFGGWYVGGVAPPPSVHRRIRQFEGLSDPALSMRLARALAGAKIEFQIRYSLRATRERTRPAGIVAAIEDMRAARKRVHQAMALDELRGYEGLAGRAYFSVLPHLIALPARPDYTPAGRTRRPPRDRMNALLSFMYALLQREVAAAIFSVGLDPSFGFMHRPRSSAYPLVLDIMELFRVPIADMATVGAVNRSTFDASEDFVVTRDQVWLSAAGKRKAIEVFERRKLDEWRHPILGSSMSYVRLIELEVRLLEKEWSNEPGLFAQMKLR